MRSLKLLLAFTLILSLGPLAESQAPELIEAARRAAYPHTPSELSSTLLLEADTSALGCDLIPGLPLPDPIEVHRLEYQLDGSDYALHITADGSLTQVCDERHPNLGHGTQPILRDSADSDGDGLADSRDSCPLIAGSAATFSTERSGCPQASSADRDGDGTPDRHDRCPDQAGVAAADGCSILGDYDRDGVPNHVDICRHDFGDIRPNLALGCPADGGGSSNRRRAVDDICQIIGGDLPVYAGRDQNAEVVSQVESAVVIGKTAGLDWVQVNDGWVKSGGAQLAGACFNIPLVNPAVGGATGCFMRPRSEAVNVRNAAFGKPVTRLLSHEQQAVLGRNASGDWLFYRAGWVSRAVLELAGNCERLPVLDPARVASGSVHFCPPDYAGFLPPRIGIGKGNARVASTTLANRLRAEPSYLAEQIGEIPPGSVIDAVLDGPACQAPFVWWQVKVGGQVGWTVESDINAFHYYLESLAKGSTSPHDRRGPALSETALPASKGLISSSNLNRVDTVSFLPLPAPTAVVWTPKQSALAAVSARGDISLFSAAGFASIPLHVSLPAAVSAIAFSSDESWLAVGDMDGGVTLIELTADWSAGQSVLLGELAGPIRALAWNKAGDKLAAISGADTLRLARHAGTLKAWDFDASASAVSAVAMHYHFPYPLTAAAFSRDSRWLAVSGESSADHRAALWVYDIETGDLALSKPLAPMRGHGLVTAAPSADLGDFVFSSGDSLYQLQMNSGAAHRFYHHAAFVITGIAFRPQVIPGAEALMALTTGLRRGTELLSLANALSPYSPTATFYLSSDAFAFSPDGRLLAVAEPDSDRIRVLGVIAQQ